MISRFLLLLSLVFAVADVAVAQGQQSPVFRVAGVGQGYDGLLFDNDAPLKVFSGSLGNSYPAPSGDTLSLYRMVPPPPGSPPGTLPQKTVVAAIPYPAGVSKVLVLLCPARAGAALPIDGIAIPDTDKDHMPGHARVINLSSLVFAFGAGRNVAQVPAHTTDRQVAYTAGPMLIKVAAHTGRGWQVVDSRQMNLSDSIRLEVILIDAPPPIPNAPPVACFFLYDVKRPPSKFKSDVGQ